MANELVAGTPTVPALSDEAKEQVIMGGDLQKLTPKQRLAYIHQLCNTLGLNPLTRPFEYLTLNNKLTLYARKDATDQLRKIHKVSLKIVERIEDKEAGSYTVVVEAQTPDGRCDQSSGSVAIGGIKYKYETDKNGKETKKAVRDENGDPVMESLKGEARANAIMKAETKAKRRATLSLMGLGFMDETEIETIPAAAKRDIPPIRPDQCEKVLTLCENDPKRVKANIEMYGVTTLGKLNVEQAEEVIAFLEKLSQ